MSQSSAPSAAPTSQPRLVAIWLLVATAIGAALVAPLGWASESTYLLVTGGSAIAAWWGTRRRPAAIRRIGIAVAAGLALSAMGDAIWSGYFLADPDTVPDVSIADIGWYGSYLAIGLALFWMLSSAGRINVDAVIDVVAVLTMAMTLQWHLVIGSTISDTSVPLTTRLVWAVYPALDAVLLALVIRVLVDRRLRSPAAILVGLGTLGWLLSDFGYVVVGGGLDTWLNAGWLLGAVFLAASTWARSSVAAPADPARDADQVGLARVGVALVPLLVPGALEMLTFARGEDFNPVPMFVASVLLVTLAFLRTARILQAERAARHALRSERSYARALATNSSDAVAVLDAAGRLRDAPQLGVLLGDATAATPGTELRRLVGVEHAEELTGVMQRCIGAPGQVFEIEVPAPHAEGHEIWLHVRMVNRLDDPDVQGIVVNLHDVTDRKLVEAELTRQAFHDGLTGLANRLLFADRVDHSLRRSARREALPAVVYLDVDGFKHVNDSLGHAAGDELLQEVGDRLVAAVRSGDTVARLGGDEFAILIEQSNRPVEEATAVAERIIQALRVPIELAERSVVVSASIGIAIGDPDSTASTLLRDADIAMYRAKTTGRAKWLLYDGDMRTAAVERLELENDLAGALDRGELRLVYQPVIQLESNRIVGFEALLRWAHPRLGLLAPARFIHIAEETGLILPIGRWVLEEACRMSITWHRQFPRVPPLTMAVNLSARQLSDPDLVRYVAEALARTGLPASSLVLEMTESVLIEDPETAAERLRNLRHLGIRLAIDDFGTGYSSLSYLRQFPVDILKIDRSFINAISDREKVPAIVRALLDLGRTLELETVAEGIESDIQSDWLRQEHCELGQGYLFAHPLGANEAELLMLQTNDGPIQPVDPHPAAP